MLRVNLDLSEEEERVIKADAETNRRSMNAEIAYLVLKATTAMGLTKDKQIKIE